MPSVQYDGNTKEKAFAKVKSTLMKQGFIVIKTDLRGLDGIAVRKIKYESNYKKIIPKGDHNNLLPSDNLIAIRIFQKKKIRNSKGRSLYTGTNTWDYNSSLTKEMSKFSDFDFVLRGFWIEGYPNKC